MADPSMRRISPQENSAIPVHRSFVKERKTNSSLKEIVDESALTVPWDLRPVHDSSSRHKLRILSSPYLWWKILYAIRMSLVAMLPLAALIAAEGTMSGFVSKSFATSGALITSKETVGASVHATVEWLKCLFLAVPISTILIYVEVYKNPYAWGAVYVVVLTFVAFVCEGLTRKLGMLLINVAMVAELRAYYDGAGLGLHGTFPIRLTAEYTMGCVTGIVASLLPFPKFAGRRADRKISEAAQNLSLCFSGLCDSFWTSSNLQRRINMVRIQYAQKTALANLDDVKGCMNECRFEPQLLDQYFLRVAKYELLCSYSPIIDSTLRVLETVSEDPFIVSGSEQAVAFGEMLEPSLKQLAAAVDASLNLVAKAKSRKEFIVQDDSEHVDEEGNLMVGMQDRRELLKCHPIRRVQLAVLNFEAAFTHARRDIYYTVKKQQATESGGGNNNGDHKQSFNDITATEPLPSTTTPISPQTQISNFPFYTGTTGYDMAPAAQEFAALMAFYIFTLSQFARKTLAFPDIVESKRRGKTFWGLVWEELWESFHSSFVICWELIAFIFCVQSVDDEKALKAAIKLRESAKVSIAMGLSVLFFYYSDREYAFFGGPAILTFVASSTSSEALYASMIRLFGTLFGGVIGFFAAELTVTPTEKVAALTVIMLFFAFFRTGKQYGPAALYACFVVVPLMSPSVRSEEAIARITQITFAAMIYTIIMITVFPTRPMMELANARIHAMSSMANAVSVLMDAFNAPILASDSTNPSRSTSSVVKRSTLRSNDNSSSGSSSDEDPWQVEKARDPAAGSRTTHRLSHDHVDKTYPTINVGDLSANFREGGEGADTLNYSIHPFGVEKPSSKAMFSQIHSVEMEKRSTKSKSSKNSSPKKPSRQASHHSNRANLVLNAALAPLTAPIPEIPAEDTFLIAAAASVKALDKLVAAAATWMPLAETEPTLTRVAFPVTANKDFHNTMVKMRSLLELMVDALRALRTQRTESPSPYFVAVIDDLKPHAMRCAEMFGLVVDMIVMTLNRRHAGLASEMVRASLRFEEECLGLHYQKSLSFQQLVKLGRIIYDKQLKLRAMKGHHHHHHLPPPALHVATEDDRKPTSHEVLPASSDERQNKSYTESPQLPKLASTVPYGQDDIQFPRSPPNRALGAAEGSTSPSCPPAVSRTIARAISTAALDSLARTDLLVGPYPRVEKVSPGIPRDDGKLSKDGVLSRMSSLPAPTPRSSGPVGKLVNGRFQTPVTSWTVAELDTLANYIINESMGLSSIQSPPHSVPTSRLATVGDITEIESQTVPKLENETEPHHNPKYRKIKMLMTNADAEGMHTFTFSLVIFSKEIKRLVMSVETLQQHMIAAE